MTTLHQTVRNIFTWIENNTFIWLWESVALDFKIIEVTDGEVTWPKVVIATSNTQYTFYMPIIHQNNAADQIYFWYIKQECNLRILLKLPLNFHVWFLRH